MASQYWKKKEIRNARQLSFDDETTKTNSRFSGWTPNGTRIFEYSRKPGESKGLHFINGTWTLNCKGQLWTGDNNYKKKPIEKIDEKSEESSKAKKIREKFEQKDYGTKGLTMAVCDVTVKGDAIVMTSLE
uniref:Uncharacterized protein n=1 Tax=Plectus sambesii TaxID=2011161 RepID=A0A914WAN6_9BILA